MNLKYCSTVQLLFYDDPKIEHSRSIVARISISLLRGVDKSWRQAESGRTGANGAHRRFIHENSLHHYPIPIEPVLSSGERLVPIQTSECHPEMPEFQ
jgi:hypothetical protein